MYVCTNTYGHFGACGTHVYFSTGTHVHSSAAPHSGASGAYLAGR